MMQKGVVSVIFNREIYEMMVLIDIVSYLIKTMIRIIIILFLILFLLSCKTEKETQNAKEYLRWVGDIEKDTLTDNPNFKVCNGDEKISGAAGIRNCISTDGRLQNVVSNGSLHMALNFLIIFLGFKLWRIPGIVSLPDACKVF